MTKLTLRELNRATLARQMLLAREKTTVPKALARLLAIQAQWPKPPFAAFWARLEGFQASDLSKLARKSAVVRGTAFRGTIFLMLPEDYAAFRSAIAPTLERAVSSMVKMIPEKEREPIVALGRSFFTKKAATFDDLRAHLEAAHVTEPRRAALLVRMRVPLLQIATDHAWAWPQAADFGVADFDIPEKRAEDALVLRYLAALGPATIADAQNFTGISKLKDVFARLRDQLVVFTDDRNKECFDLPKAPRPGADVEAPVRFLPDFDNVILSHADRRRFVADEHKSRVYGNNLSALRTFLIDGTVAGIWRSEAKKTAVLTVEPFVKLTKATASALEEEGDKLLAFLEPEARAREIRIVR